MEEGTAAAVAVAVVAEAGTSWRPSVRQFPKIIVPGSTPAAFTSRPSEVKARQLVARDQTYCVKTVPTRSRTMRSTLAGPMGTLPGRNGDPFDTSSNSSGRQHKAMAPTIAQILTVAAGSCAQFSEATEAE